jgi:OmpA-OmpF porin, OOP family
MKCCILVGLLIATCVFGQPEGRIEPKPYVRGDLGVAITEDADASFFPGVGSVTMDLDPGIRFSAAGGALFGDYFALELETGWIINEIDSITGFNDVDGYVSQVPFLLNARFEFRNNTGLTPFIGAGAGGTATGINLDDADAGTFDVDGSAADVVFAWQAFGGLKYELNENLSVGIIYKYFWSDDAEWDVEDTTQDIIFEGARSHSISAVVSYKF